MKPAQRAGFGSAGHFTNSLVRSLTWGFPDDLKISFEQSHRFSEKLTVESNEKLIAATSMEKNMVIVNRLEFISQLMP
jgi:hypothetical protein